MASLRKRGDRFYLLFFDASRTPKQKTVPLGRVSSKAAGRLRSSREDEYAAGRYDPWAVRSDLSVAEAVQAFKRSRRKKSPSTRAIYESILSRLAEAVGPRNLIASIGAADVTAFLDSTKTGDVSKKTYLAHVSAFWEYCAAEDWCDGNVCDGVQLERVPTVFPRYYSEVDLDRLIAAIEASATNDRIRRGDPRWLIPLIRFAVETGLRRGEIVNLRWEDVLLDKARMLVRNRDGFKTKSGSDRSVPLSTAAMRILDELPRTHELVFVTSSGRPIYPNYLARLFRKYASDLGLHDTSIHALRHTACSRLADRGVPVDVIRRFAGHSSIMVTMKYMHLSEDGSSQWFT